MSKTILRAGRCVVCYSDDGQGRRLSVGTPINGVVRDPVIVASTKAELVEVIAALKQLAEELPGAPSRAVSATPPRSPQS